MSHKPIEEYTDKELVKTSGIVEGPNSASAAQAELTRRLMETIREANTSTTRYSRVLFVLTFVMFVVAVLQLVVTIFDPLPSLPLLSKETSQFVMFVGAMLFIGWVLYSSSKDFLKD